MSAPIRAWRLGWPGADDRAEVVDEARDLELEVAGLGRGQEGGALEAVGEQVDGLAVEVAVADGEAREELVDGLGAGHGLHCARGGGGGRYRRSASVHGTLT